MDFYISQELLTREILDQIMTRTTRLIPQTTTI